MAEEIKTNDKSDIASIRKISDSIDYITFNKIINKLTDYAETLSEGKISGIINFNYRLNSVQTSEAIKLLEDMQGITRIYSLSLKGSKDIEVEYISNIYSDYEHPEAISSYISLKNIIENRLTHQVQQYNINMGKNNTTMAIPVNELRGHVKTYRDLHGQNISIATKAQHGYIAASLHDAYVTLLNKPDYWNEKSYMKFFFNEDDQSRRKTLLLKREKRLSIREIAHNVKKILDGLQAIQQTRMHPAEPTIAEAEQPVSLEDLTKRSKSDAFTDRMLQTPFGRQYGSIIEKIITRTYDPARKKSYDEEWENAVKEKILILFKAYKVKEDLARYGKEITDVVEYLLMQEYGIKSFTEKFLYADRRESFSKYYTEYIQEHVEQFLSQLFNIYFEISFSSLFKIIKSADMKKFACAYIIKRIYIDEGENLTDFGFFFIRVIAKKGGIKSQ